GLHSRHEAKAATIHDGLERAAAYQYRVEAAIDFPEIESRIHDDPVALTVRTADVRIQAHGDRVADPSHQNLPRKRDRAARCAGATPPAAYTLPPGSQAVRLSNRPLIPVGVEPAGRGREVPRGTEKSGSEREGPEPADPCTNRAAPQSSYYES